MPARASSAEPVKSRKRGTRSVSNLSPPQLARKRANDREAQRAIRARTKEHIERLERELEELRSQPRCHWTVEELLRQNKALELELRLLRKRQIDAVSITSSPYSAPTGVDDNVCTPSVSSVMSSPVISPLPSNIDCPPFPGFDQQQYNVAGPDYCHSWVTAISSGAAFTPLNVPSPVLPIPNYHGASAATATDVPIAVSNEKLESNSMQVIGQGNLDYELPRRNRQHHLAED